MALTVRRATLADLPALLALERDFPGDRLVRSSFRHLLTRAHAGIWVCLAADALVGNAIVLFRKHSRRARLYSLIVTPSARGRGIARALVESVETAVAERGCNRMYLEVRDDNAVAVRLYQRLGYRFVRRIENFYEDGRDALQLERPLGESGKSPDLAA